jgi:porphobilinogen synthase
MQTLDGTALNITKRPRRNRKSPAIRALVQETHLHASQLVAPLFVLEGTNERQIIQSMPGVERLSIDLIVKEVEQLYALGVRGVDLFPVIPKEKKDAWGTEALANNNLIEKTIKAIKKTVPDMCVMVDIALDPFTDHGHDGVVDVQGNILNDETIFRLAQMSVLAAEAGADIVAPSDMMDGRIGYIRQALDLAGHEHVNILSYAAKYASAFYGPFREALQSAPKFGDKKTYQMNPANSREALLECALDELEGADMLLIKPALAYLDIIAKVRESTHLPVGAYHVSGEYSMVMAAAQNGWLDADKIFMESLISMRRAGAEFILTYTAKRIAQILKG